MKHICLIILVVCFLPLFGQVIKTETFWLEKTAVKVQLFKYGAHGEKAVFINLHENETTSISAVKTYLKKKNGHFIAIKQKGLRNLGFVLKGTKYIFDPNRMFTKEGRIANLKLLNKKYSKAAEEEVEEFSDKIISRIKKANIIIALHNNTNGKPLSVSTYRETYVNPSMDPDDFVLTTEPSIFDQLKAKKINAVLETTKSSVDDGSLAYFCSQKNIPYINVEAQAGHRLQQLKMLNALTDIIAHYTK